MRATFESQDGREIVLDLHPVIVNNGIGAYEFWGQRCYDHGQPEVEEFQIVSISEESCREQAEAWIAEHFHDLQEEALQVD